MSSGSPGLRRVASIVALIGSTSASATAVTLVAESNAFAQAPGAGGSNAGSGSTAGAGAAPSTPSGTSGSSGSGNSGSRPALMPDATSSAPSTPSAPPSAIPSGTPSPSSPAGQAGATSPAGTAAGAGTPITVTQSATPLAPSTTTNAPIPPAPHVVTMTPIDPKGDQRKLSDLGDTQPSSDGMVGSDPKEVYSEDWWGHTRPLLELHGYFRTRGEVFHDFTLGRHNNPNIDTQNLWRQPIDQTYGDTTGTEHAITSCSDSPNFTKCIDKTQSSANLRFRINPELHISDNLRIMSQLDLLNNLVLGSTPDSYAVTSGGGASTNGYAAAGGNPYAQIGFFSNTQGSPTAGVNSTQNAINVNRVWAEYMTPVGQLKFGRMPDHFGLGMVHNSGDGIDSDYQSTVDRIMFTTGIKSLDLYFAGTWDFVSSGATNASPYNVYGGELYNTGNLTNVNQWSAMIVRRKNPELQRLALARNEVVINAGAYVSYRSQVLDVAENTTTGVTGTPLSTDFVNATNNGLERRGAYEYIPDLWFQVLWQKFRFEAELASYFGAMENSANNSFIQTATKIREYGLTTQTEFKAVEDKLRLQFGFGWASGDPWQQSLNPSNTLSRQELNNGHGPISEFAFHPDYRVDLIFFRNILSRVEGAYYFRPSVDYDFLRSQDGQKLGGGAAIIWSRATDFEQTPGHARDLGVEMDLSVYYQAKDGSLNDDPTKVGGFFAMLQYGVFFPLGGLSYLPGEQNNNLPSWDTSSAQTVRLFLGVVY